MLRGAAFSWTIDSGSVEPSQHACALGRTYQSRLTPRPQWCGRVYIARFVDWPRSYESLHYIFTVVSQEVKCHWRTKLELTWEALGLRQRICCCVRGVKVFVGFCTPRTQQLDTHLERWFCSKYSSTKDRKINVSIVFLVNTMEVAKFKVDLRMPSWGERRTALKIYLPYPVLTAWRASSA